MIIDAFLFCNELDLLEARFRILDAVVDRFVVAESTVTFAGTKKPLWFAENRDRFGPWRDKINHVAIADTPDSGQNRWAREHFQRNAIVRGLTDVGFGDLVALSDVDEIPDPATLGLRRMGGYTQVFSVWYINAICRDAPWVGTTVLPRITYDRVTPQDVRNRRHEFPRWAKGGWHFAYLMDAADIHAKLRSFSHAEWDNPETHATIEVRRQVLRDPFGAHERPLDVVDVATGYFPQYLKDNLQRYQSWLTPTSSSVSS